MNRKIVFMMDLLLCASVGRWAFSVNGWRIVCGDGGAQLATIAELGKAQLVGDVDEDGGAARRDARGGKE